MISEIVNSDFYKYQFFFVVKRIDFYCIFLLLWIVSITQASKFVLNWNAGNGMLIQKCLKPNMDVDYGFSRTCLQTTIDKSFNFDLIHSLIWSRYMTMYFHFKCQQLTKGQVWFSCSLILRSTSLHKLVSSILFQMEKSFLFNFFYLICHEIW